MLKVYFLILAPETQEKISFCVLNMSSIFCLLVFLHLPIPPINLWEELHKIFIVRRNKEVERKEGSEKKRGRLGTQTITTFKS